MKTKIILLISAVALVTLSFTFANVNNPKSTEVAQPVAHEQGPVGGLFADEVVE